MEKNTLIYFKQLKNVTANQFKEIKTINARVRKTDD